MKMDTDDYQVRESQRIDLKKWPTVVKSVYKSDKQYRKLLTEHVQQLSDLQQLLYAANQYSILLIFQAMDAAGKDGAIRHVMSGVNPQGCQVYSFKHPSAEELQHDFLWRTTRNLPERGRIGIFNRSYYEEVLIVRVHAELLRTEGVPGGSEGRKIWKTRFQSIRHLEEHLYCNGTRIVKFFLHLSKEEQRRRFLERIDAPSKNWKFSLADIEERQYWKQYAQAYEDCLQATNTKHCPWFVVPADDKRNARLIVSQVVVNALSALKLAYPEATPQRRRELKLLRARLAE